MKYIYSSNLLNKLTKFYFIIIYVFECLKFRKIYSNSSILLLLKKFPSSTNFNQDIYIYIQFSCAVLRTLINSIPRQPTPPAGEHPSSINYSPSLVNSNSISSSILEKEVAERRNPAEICPRSRLR